jgi:hypothetical protein
LPFTLIKDDIHIPARCPVLDIPLSHGAGKGGKHHGSPTLDRLTPDLGYVPGNVLVVSELANAIKSDATPAQIRAVADFYDNHLRTQETLQWDS